MAGKSSSVKEKSLNGIKYWESGNKSDPALLFVHGFTGSHEGFQYIIPEIKGYRIIAPDLPGFGVSLLGDIEWTIDGIAKKVVEFVKKLEIKGEKPVIVSHSMGTLVAASMLASEPKLFNKKTVFVSPVPEKIEFFDSRMPGAVLGQFQYWLGAVWPAVGEKIVKNESISKATTRFIATTKDKEFMKVIDGHHLNNLNYISSMAFYKEIFKDINSRGVSDHADSLKGCKNLIINGALDNISPIKRVVRLADAIDADLELIPDVGHLLHYETPEKVAGAIADFLK